MFSWTGVYAGVNIGYGFGTGESANGFQTFDAITLAPILPIFIAVPGGATWTAPTNLSGIIGGFQLGANYQLNSWLVLGVETDIQGAGLSSNTAVTASFLRFGLLPEVGLANFGTRVDWYGSLRARVGITPLAPNLMIYGTGGLAYGDVRSRFDFTSLATIAIIGYQASGTAYNHNIEFGWTAGAGLEWAPASFPNWSVRVEYLYTDLGQTTLSTAGSGALTIVGIPILQTANGATNTTYNRWHSVRAGRNYRFNWGAPPVVASY
jgi:outer membrane immunogenic protein